MKVDPDDSCFTNSTVTGPVPGGRIPLTTPPVTAVTVAGAGVGAGVEGVMAINVMLQWAFTDAFCLHIRPSC